MTIPLASGAEGRWTNDARRHAVVLVGGGQGVDVPGTWSSTVEWLVRRLAPRFPELGLLEVRYRVKSWKRLQMCAEDAAAGVARAVEEGAERCALVGYSMGGGVAIMAAGDPVVTTVVGLAPSIPPNVDLTPLRTRRFAAIHGALDRPLPFAPGVHPDGSRRAFDRAQALGADDSEYTLIPGAAHAVALRSSLGLVPLPRARRWAELLGRELERFARP